MVIIGRTQMQPYPRWNWNPRTDVGGFDVYNIETAMPKIDLDAIESHLRAAREEERRRRNDREEIRRRLAMGSDADEYYGGERPGRKPSLQARLQSGMNLQICFMNETVSDPESPSSDTESSSSPAKSSPEKMAVPRSHTLPIKQPLPAAPVATATRPSTSLLSLPLRREPDPAPPMTEADFFARQAQLQAEARLALAQAKEMAHMQMEVERQRQKKSPITEMVRSSLEKVGIPFPEDRRRVSRQLLTEMNVAQLQVIVNDLHTQIEVLNEGLDYIVFSALVIAISKNVSFECYATFSHTVLVCQLEGNKKWFLMFNFDGYKIH
ncbi:Schwannomin-interacting protein 1 homolog [Gryllus bimaculatus]|nr:Schwannomin-interacting protein 1 homolog [Gryllus bimaculatus]